MNKIALFLILALVAYWMAMIGLVALSVGGKLGALIGLCVFGGYGIVILGRPARVFGCKRAATRRERETDAARFGFNWPQMAVMAMGGIMVIMGSLFMTRAGASHWLVFSVQMSSVGFLVPPILNALLAHPVVVIDTNGLWDHRILRQPLAWSDIEALSVAEDPDVHSLTIHPRAGAQSNARKKQLRINTSDLDGAIADIVLAIRRIKPDVNIMAPKR